MWRIEWLSARVADVFALSFFRARLYRPVCNARMWKENEDNDALDFPVLLLIAGPALLVDALVWFVLVDAADGCLLSQDISDFIHFAACATRLCGSCGLSFYPRVSCLCRFGRLVCSMSAFAAVDVQRSNPRCRLCRRLRWCPTEIQLRQDRVLSASDTDGSADIICTCSTLRIYSSKLCPASRLVHL